MLKKEFKRKDVDRMRNLIKGNVNDSSESQIGYKKKKKEYKEGDIWTENQKTWTVKNGIKQTISKLDKIKKEIFLPLCCPKCNKIMKSRFDEPNYRIHKKCLNCVVNFEHKLKCKGKYDDYMKNLKAKNSLDMIDDMESFLLNAINAENDGYISEQGEIERWVGGINKEKMTKEIIKSTQIRRKSILKEISEEK